MASSFWRLRGAVRADLPRRGSDGAAAAAEGSKKPATRLRKLAGCPRSNGEKLVAAKVS
jgi:hypothetical protein